MDTSAPLLQPETRPLLWEGCCNIRNLGGLPLEGGGHTRYGVVVRADDVSLLSETGWRAAAEYGVRRIVDLRHEYPAYDAPVDLVRIPLLNPPAVAEVDEPGLVVALILRDAGVGSDTIAGDYAESEANWEHAVPDWIAEAPDDAERRKRTLLSVMPQEAMRDTVADLEREHGSIRRFLVDAGVGEPALDRLRARLRR